MQLTGKVALVTGSGPNINGGIAYGLADAGAKVACVDLRRDYAEACANAIVGRGGSAAAFICDVTREDQVERTVRAVEATLCLVDVLVNGAVIQIRKGLLDVTRDEFERQIDVGLLGTFLFTRTVARRMIETGRRGSIINIGSTEGHQGNPGNLAYGTAKGAVLHFTRAAAMDLAPHGIRVNSLSPTGTDPAEGQERAAAWGVAWEAGLKAAPRPDTTSGDQGVPLGKRPSPHHYAQGVVFLASESSEMITGIDLRVDGGVVSRYWRWNPGAMIAPSAVS